jgi:hypothetical protein
MDYLADGYRLSVLFQSLISLRFRELRDISDLDLILAACNEAQQVARLRAQDERDTTLLKTLAKSMVSRQKVWLLS